MSDSRIYELEDIVWDDFSISDDHLVPYPQIQQNEGSFVHTESSKKHEAGLISSSGPGSHDGERVGVATEKSLFSPPRITDDNVLVNGSWSHKPDNCQIGNDLMSNLSSEGPTVTRGNFLSNNNFNTGASDSINNCSAADNKNFNSLSDTPQSESDFSFLYNGLDNKGVDDSLFCDWPEIGNYDLNQMLRSCDSAFGLGDPAKEDDMCWFSSTTAGQSCVSKASSISDLPTNSLEKDSGKPLIEVNKNPRNMDYQTQSTEKKVSLHHSDCAKPKSKTQRSFHKASHELLSSNPRGLQTQNESLNKTSQSNEHPLEETSLLQLQEVMEQMDLKTKLCIRDSLYRLARSAEQRHGIPTMNGAFIVDKNPSDQLIAGKKHPRLIDIETDTNPIDRSIAHLLFHRPSDSSKMLHINTSHVHNTNDGSELLHSNDIKHTDMSVAKTEK